MKPLFKWAGGKNKMLKHYLDVMPKSVNSYCEPFFGGGAMFIYIKNTYNPSFMKINDINSDVMWIYRAIKDHYDEFIARLDQLEQDYLKLETPTKDNKRGKRWQYYMDVRNEHAYNFASWTKPYEAATLYFLMKVSFNGIYQLNQNTNGRYGTPPGLLLEKEAIYDRDVVKWWHEALQNTELCSGDWTDAVKDCPPDTFFFFDPPYRSSFADYGNSFSDDRQLELIDFASQQDNVMLCNRDDDGWFVANNKGLSYKHIDITYTAGRRKKTEVGFEAKKAKEILLFRAKEYRSKWNELFTEPVSA